MIKITDFQEHGKGFMCRVSNDIPIKPLNNVLFYTNKQGKRLWQGNGVNNQQILGTCQFSVSGLKIQSMKNKLRKFLSI